MKRSILITALLAMALVGCEKKQPPNTVQQCGYDAQSGETKCIYVPAGQAQQQVAYGQPSQVIEQPAQVIQAAPAPNVTVVNTPGSSHSGAGDAMVGMAAGMMIGNAMSNNSGGRYDDSYARAEAERRARLADRRADRAELRADMANQRALMAQQQAQPMPMPAPVPVAPPPVKSQTLTIPPKQQTINTPIASYNVKQTVTQTTTTSYAPKNTVTPTFKAPVAPAPKVSTPSAAPKSSFTVTRSSTTSNGFKR